MNCLIRTLSLKGSWYTIYVQPTQKWQLKRIRCPDCGEVQKILVSQMKYRLRNMQRVDRYYPPTWYLSGKVLSIRDQDNFFYILGGDHVCVPVAAPKELEGMDRIFIRKGYRMCVSGQMEKKKVCSSVTCKKCGKKNNYWTDQYFMMEQNRKIFTEDGITGGAKE